MATSGTVGATVVNTDRMIEHAIRRVGLLPSSITSETLNIAKDNLYLLMLLLANRGLNLWCVLYDYIGIEPGKVTYQLPIGTISLLELYYVTPQQVTGTDSSTLTTYTTELADATRVIRVGAKFTSIPASTTINIQYSDDGIAWSTVMTITRADWAAGRWYWWQLPQAVQAGFFRLQATVGPITVTNFYLATSVFEQKIQQYNRDEYFNLPNRQMPGRPSTNFYYEKLVPLQQYSLWPAPTNEFDHITIVYHRQIQDVGLLTQEVEIPDRWKEQLIWQLADRLAFELPGIPPDRIQMIAARAQETYNDSALGETDGASIRIQPQISTYTR